MFVPQSHKLGKLKAIDLAEPEDIFSLVNREGTSDSQKPVIVRMKAGSYTLHDGLTFHFLARKGSNN